MFPADNVEQNVNRGDIKQDPTNLP